jgi:hypothetical protein
VIVGILVTAVEDMVIAMTVTATVIVNAIATEIDPLPDSGRTNLYH